MPHLALVGDHSDDVPAHRAIPLALRAAEASLGVSLSWTWVPSTAVSADGGTLADYAGVWLVPGSPYASMDGALAAVRFARESRRPFLGTCGGFQHALIEIARDLAHLADADHSESNPAATTPIVTRLACSLVEATGDLTFTAGSLIAAAYDAASAREGYRCNYGLNARYRDALADAGVRFTAFDAAGEIRGAELPTAVHPFFVGTLFQPERAALAGKLPPLVTAFAAAAAHAAGESV